MDKSPIILTGPPGSGKSHWIQQYAVHVNKQLFVCPCRKDRTLRDGRQKLHIWARRTEPSILWLEGADDLTPEAQAFLRRILETHSSDVIFILECRDSGRLQEPIRSRCIIKRMSQPTWNELEAYITSTYKGANTSEIKNYLHLNEYSYRRAMQCAYLQYNYPAVWRSTYEHRIHENAEVLCADNLIDYMHAGYNPEHLISKLVSNDNILKDYGRCMERGGSLWAFLGSALYIAATTPTKEEE
jgi:hypothetical protein